MGANTTLHVSRTTAMTKLLMLIPQMENETLERLLDRMFDDKLYNFRVGWGDPDGDDQTLMDL